MNRNSRKVVSVILAVLMAFTIFPNVMGGAVYAANNTSEVTTLDGVNSNDTNSDNDKGEDYQTQDNSAGGTEGSSSNSDAESSSNLGTLDLEDDSTEPTKATEVGDGTESKPYIISNETQMLDLQSMVANGDSFDGKYIELANDITLGSDFTGIGSSSKPFKGNFDGKGHKLTVEIAADTNNVALFGYASGATISNLTVAGSVTGTYNVAGIIGYNSSSSVINCTNEATITATTPPTSYSVSSGVAGISAAVVGSDVTIENCVNKEDIVAGFTSSSGLSTISFGGIVGTSFNSATNFTISNCQNSGNLVDIPSTVGVGGIIGRVYNTHALIEDCNNTGDISAAFTGSATYGGVGGIAGYYSANKADSGIARCQNSGEIVGANNAYASAGGVVGKYASTYTLSQSLNRGSVSAVNGSVGGVVGQLGSGATVEECYNGGSVVNTKTATPTYSSPLVAGGVVGYQAGNAYIKGCYNYGEVDYETTLTGTYVYVGGIIGRPTTPIQSSTVDKYVFSSLYLDTTASLAVGGIDASGEGWKSFSEDDSTADIISTIGNSYQKDLTPNINNGYPILRWENEDATFSLAFNIKDAETGSALNDANVSIEGYEADADGNFELAPGTYTYEITNNGYEKITDEVTIKKSSRTLSIEMTSVKHEYVIKVSPADSKLVVSNDDAPEIAEPTKSVDEDNDVATYTYTLADNEAYGAYSYRISKYMYVAQKGTIKATGTGDELTVNLANAEYSEFQFKISPANAKISLVNSEYDVVAEAKSNEDGIVKYDLIPGEYTYKVKASGYKTETGTFEVPDKNSLEVTLEAKDKWDGVSVDTDWYSASAEVMEISEPEELAGLAKLVNDKTADFKGQKVVLTKDINLGGDAETGTNPWTAIGGYRTDSFKGTFDGQNHTISNLYLYLDGTAAAADGYKGLFGYTSGATIENIVLDNETILSQDGKYYQYVGGLVGKATTTEIDNISVSGRITLNHVNSYHIGGIVGTMESGGTVTNCVNNANITGGYAVAGIVGDTSYNKKATIKWCINNGNITATKSESSTGTSGTYYSAAGVVSNLYNTGDELAYCVNTGDISGQSRSLGGVAGTMAYSSYGSQSLHDCYNIGNVSGEAATSCVGGVVGYINTSKNVSVKNCYNAGELTSTTYIGGVIGYQSSTTVDSNYLANNYYLYNENYKGSYSGSAALENEAFSYFDKDPDYDYSTLIEKLGDAYCADVKDGDSYKYANGYPVLKWQVPGAKYTLGFDISYDNESNLSDDTEVKIEVKDSNGNVKEASDGKYELDPGTYTYTVSREGYEDQSGEVKVQREALTESVKLTAVKYAYVVNIDKSVDYTLYKVTDYGDSEVTKPSYDESEDDSLGSYTYKLYNGNYKYVAKKMGYVKETGEFAINFKTANKTIELEAAKASKVKFTVKAAEGSFEGTDPEISVYSADEDFDGKLMGTYDNTSMISEGLMFPVGNYSYKIKADGFTTYEGEFTVEEGAGVEVEATLEVKTGWAGEEDVDTDWYTNNSDATEFTIRSESEFAGLAKLVNEDKIKFTGKTIKLASDLNLADNDWKPIGGGSYSSSKYFGGTFDGQGHTIVIKNGEFKANDSTFGVFGWLSGATISNLVLEGNVDITYESDSTSYAAFYVGGLAGYAGNSTKITNCSNQMKITVNVTNGGTIGLNLGGLVGWSVGASYENCNNIAAITGNVVSTNNNNASPQVGGLIGFQNSASSSNAATVTNCYATGEVSASTNYSSCVAGGLIGTLSGGYSNSFTMSNVYTAADVTASCSGTANVSAIIGSRAGGTFSNNYYLDNGLTEPSDNSSKKTDEEMRAADFAEALGDAYTTNNNGGYPIFSWEKGVDHIAVTTEPEKLVYDDLSAFDDTGMKITAYKSTDDSDATEVSSGWSIKNGKSLKATQTSVTVEYKGATVELPITVNQVVHIINSDELELDITAPEAGETPQETIQLTSEQAEKYSAEINWTKAGEEFEGDFEEASYYRAHVTLTSIYEEDEVYYAFARGAYPTVDSAYEIKNYYQGWNEDDERTTVEFDVTFKATTSASKVEDKTSHLYYEGDSEAAYGDLLNNSLQISIGDEETSYSVKDLEELVLNKNVGVQGTYAGTEYTGIKLYELLCNSGLSQSVTDDTVIYLYGRTSVEKTKVTVGELRTQDSETAPIIAYGNADRGTPLGTRVGPLMMIQSDEDAASRTNLTMIKVVDPEDADNYKTTFNVNVEDPSITVKDEYNNEIAANEDAANVFTLRDGETYTYEVTKEGYTVVSDELTVNGEDSTIEITLEPAWDGKTLTEPAVDEDGYYLIGTAAELMWWHENYSATDKVKLTDDIILNDGKNNTNKWDVLGTNSGYASGGTPAFQGTFDGNGHVIKGLKIDRVNTYTLELAWDGSALAYSDRHSEIGMFGYTGGSAEIKNLGLEGSIEVFDRPDSPYADWLQVGGIVGFAQGSTKISNCYTNLAIKAVASTETELVGGYPVGGYGYACDIYMGGIAGSLSSSSTITNCYSKGTFIGAETRQVSIGGIVGGQRYQSNSVSNCYSTASIQAKPLSTTAWNSYLGGISGYGDYNNSAAAIANCFALNKSIKSNDVKSVAGRVAGSATNVSGSYGLESMKIDGAAMASGVGEDTVNGAGISTETAKTAAPYSAWSTDDWKFVDGEYPMLAWQTEPASADKTTSYGDQEYDDSSDDWDGYFSSQTPPPYYSLYYKVAGHDTILAKKFTKAEIQSLAAADNSGTLHYSAIGNGYAGRAVKEYVYLETLFDEAGVSFEEGDSIEIGNVKFNYDYLMADRYYYPDWTSGSAAGAEQVKPILALKSYGASSGMSKDMWKYYEASADYLYAYMLNYGQTSPDDATYTYFSYQQTEGVINYEADSAANDAVKNTLSNAIAEAKALAAATNISETGEDIATNEYYVTQSAMETYLDAIEAANEAMNAEDATNDSVMDAYEDLTSATKAFEKAKKLGNSSTGTGEEVNTLEALIDIAEQLVNDVVISTDGSNVDESKNWATQESVDTLKYAIWDAQYVLDDEDVTTAELEAAMDALSNAIENFASGKGLKQAVAKDAALDELVDFVSKIDLEQYRDEEKSQMADILKQYKEEIENAKTVNQISELLSDAKKAISAVKVESEAIKAEAQTELAEYINLSDIPREDRAVIREIISDYNDLIAKAEDQDEIDELVEKAKADIDLQRAKDTAIDELEALYDTADNYYEAQSTLLTKYVVLGINNIKKATGTEDIASIVESVNTKASNLKTKGEVDNTPKKVTIKNAIQNNKKTAKVTWKKTSKTTGYEVYRATSKNGKYKKVTTTKSTKYVNKKLKKGKTYYYKVRAYKVYNGKKLYGSFSKVKKVKIKW